MGLLLFALGILVGALVGACGCHLWYLARIDTAITKGIIEETRDLRKASLAREAELAQLLDEFRMKNGPQ